jgi:hypothetical protein
MDKLLIIRLFNDAVSTAEVIWHLSWDDHECGEYVRILKVVVVAHLRIIYLNQHKKVFLTEQYNFNSPKRKTK